MRISDWSSDVCSSDLVTLAGVTAAVMGWTLAATATVAFGAGDLSARDAEIAERDRKIAAMQADVQRIRKAADEMAERVEMRQELGRESGRERVSQSV